MLPLPSRTHPKKQNLVVYTKELTHLMAYQTSAVRCMSLRPRLMITNTANQLSPKLAMLFRCVSAPTSHALSFSTIQKPSSACRSLPTTRQRDHGTDARERLDA